MLLLPRLARSLLPIAVMAALSPLSARSAELPPEEVAALRVEIAALQARLAALEARAAEAPAATAASDAIVATEASDDAPVVDAGPGLEIASADGDASFGIGGRIHYDLYAHDTDALPATGGSEFRRARFQIEGAAAGWGYVLQIETAGGISDLGDVYLERGFGDATLYVGQFKPFRSMDELTSSNDMTAMERGVGSASGLFADRQWQQGVGVLTAFDQGSFGVSAFSLREGNTRRNEGWGAAARGTWTPLRDGDRLVHLGASYSIEQGGENTPGIDYEFAYGGRRGPEALLFESVDGSDFEQRTGGIEFAGTLGGFHWQGEWTRATVAGLAGDGRLDAAYLQAGWIFGGVREYDVGEGVFGSPADIGEGLWEVVARVDRIRLRDVGGVEAKRVVLGANWYVNDDLRFMLNWTRGEDVTIGDEPSQLALRAQYVF